jgi:hypothetical protein
MNRLLTALTLSLTGGCARLAITINPFSLRMAWSERVLDVLRAEPAGSGYTVAPGY